MQIGTQSHTGKINSSNAEISSNNDQLLGVYLDSRLNSTFTSDLFVVKQETLRNYVATEQN